MLIFFRSTRKGSAIWSPWMRNKKLTFLSFSRKMSSLGWGLISWNSNIIRQFDSKKVSRSFWAMTGISRMRKWYRNWGRFCRENSRRRLGFRRVWRSRWNRWGVGWEGWRVRLILWSKRKVGLRGRVCSWGLLIVWWLRRIKVWPRKRSTWK